MWGGAGGEGIAPIFSRAPDIWYILSFRLMLVRDGGAEIISLSLHVIERKMAMGRQCSLLEISQVVAEPT